MFRSCLVSVIILFLISNCLFSQNPSWQWSYTVHDSTSAARAKNCVDSQGNVYLMGCYSSPTLAFGNFTLVNVSYPGMIDSYLVKFDRAGKVIWAKNFGGVENDLINDMYIDDNDRIYIGGQFNSYLFPVGFFYLSVTDSTGYYHDTFVAELDTAGQVVMALNAGGPGHDQCWAVCGDNTGIILAGNYGKGTFTIGNTSFTNSMTDGSSDFFIAKYDHAGNLLWNKSGGGAENDWIMECAADKAGNIYASVIFRDQALTSNVTYSTAGDFDILLVKYDAQGQVIWERHYGGDARDYISQLKVTDQAVYFAGQTRSSSLQTGIYTTTTSSQNVYVLLFGKMDFSGTIQWLKTGRGINYYGLDPVGLATDPENNIFMAANFSGDSVIVDGTVAKNYVPGMWNNEIDFVITKYSSSGNQLWLKTYGVTDWDWAYGLSADNNGSIFLSGYHRNTLPLENLTLSNPYGGMVPFIAKYGTPNYTAIDENKIMMAEVFPNPVSSKLNLSNLGMGPKTISLYDGRGRLIRSFQTSEADHQLTCEDLSTGIYLLEIKDTETRRTHKVIRE